MTFITAKLFLSHPTGADTLRCLAMATVDTPGPKEEMNLEDPKNFVQYEVRIHKKKFGMFVTADKVDAYPLIELKYNFVDGVMDPLVHVLFRVT